MGKLDRKYDVKMKKGKRRQMTSSIHVDKMGRGKGESVNGKR